MVRSDAIPTLCGSDKTTQTKAVTTGTITTSQIRPDKTHVQSYPLRDGIYDEGFDFEADQTGRSHDPNDRDHGPLLHMLAR